MINLTDIPNNWKLTKLIEFAHVIMGQSPPSNTYNYQKIGLPFFQGKAEFTDLHPIIKKWCSEPNKISLPDDILLSVRAPVGAVNIANVECCIGRGLSAIRYPECNKFLFYFFRFVEKKLDEKGTGSTFRAISGDVLKNVTLFLPPLREQHRIVAKIEALFSELDKGIESFKTAREQLKIYRQALLKHAFSGKLTEQWRAENQDKLETAEALLQRIQTEREQRYQQHLKEWEANGILGGKPKAPKTLPLLTTEELAELPELPKEWIWVRPEDICAPEPYSIGIGPFGSNLKVSDYRECGIPLIFVKNITRSNFFLDLKYIDEIKYKELISHSVKALDLVITKMGDPPGDCEIYPENAPNAVLTADCLKFRLWEKFANRKLYKFSINSNLVKRQLGLITKGVAQKKISVERFKTVCLPFLCVEEQQMLVQEIDSKLSLCDQLDQTLTTALQQAQALRQSILKKAFSGQLVPQDPKDEPASVLLQRIQAEKVALVTPIKIKGKKLLSLKLRTS